MRKYIIAIALVFIFYFGQNITYLLYDYLFGFKYLLISNSTIIEVMTGITFLIITVSLYLKVKVKKYYYNRNSNIIILLGLVYLVVVMLSPLLKLDEIIGLQETYSSPELPSIYNQIWILFISVIILPVNEGVIFRGVILRLFSTNKKSITLGVFVSSVLYSVFYIDYNNFTYSYFIYVFILGAFYNVLYLRYGLIFSIIAHSFVNIMAFLAYYYKIYLNFINYIEIGFTYWFIIVVSFIVILFLLYKNYVKLIEDYLLMDKHLEQ